MVRRRGRRCPDEVRSALFVNLLTEDNLPYYFRTIERMFGADSVWGTWARRWTAEEGRHSIVIRDYLTVTRAIDPVQLERARMAQVECGEVPEPETPQDGFAYVALQELATRIAHHNTGKLLTDKAGYDVMKKVASDENRHYLFYRDLVQRRPRGRPVRHGRSPSSARCATSRCPAPGSWTSRPTPRPSPRRASTTSASTTTRSSLPVVLRHWGIEHARGPRRRGREGPGRAREAHRPHRQGRPPLRRPPRRGEAAGARDRLSVARPPSASLRLGGSANGHARASSSSEPRTRWRVSACCVARGVERARGGRRRS